MTARRLGERPICEMWQRGRCTLSNLQCNFRHSNDGPPPPPSLGDPFVSVSRSQWLTGRYAGDDYTERRPLETIWAPSPGGGLVDDPGFRTQSTRSGDNNSHHRDSPVVETGRGPVSEITNEPSNFDASKGEYGPVDNLITFHDSFQFDIWDNGPETPTSASTVRPQCSTIRQSDVERSSTDVDVGSSEFEIWDDATDQQSDQGVAAATRYGGSISSERENRGEEVGLASPRLRDSRPSHPHSFLSNSTDQWPSSMNQSRDYAQNGAASRSEGNGPHPSFIQVATPYIFEQKLQSCLTALGASEHKEDSIRLQGVHWIDSVRKALQLPIRTFNTAVVYYHKFRLVHADNEYMFIDAAAAALFTACKIEDTLKKSREVLCAAYNLKVALSDHLSPDDQLFEGPSKTVVGLERLMLESAGFDFRNRHPQEIVFKLVRDSNMPKETLGRTAYNMSIDIYRTFAPLKESAQTMAIACVELAARLLNLVDGFDMDPVVGPHGIDLNKWSTTRAEVMETMLDLLELFTHHRNATIAGGQFSIDNFISVRIVLNKEATSLDIPRYAEWVETPASATNGTANGSNKPTPVSPAVRSNPSPNSPPPMGPTAANGAKSRVGERGKDGTVRFMLSADRARAEKDVVAKYFAPDEYEEYEEEMEVPIK